MAVSHKVHFLGGFAECIDQSDHLMMVADQRLEVMVDAVQASKVLMMYLSDLMKYGTGLYRVLS